MEWIESVSIEWLDWIGWIPKFNGQKECMLDWIFFFDKFAWNVVEDFLFQIPINDKYLVLPWAFSLLVY